MPEKVERPISALKKFCELWSLSIYPFHCVYGNTRCPFVCTTVSDGNFNKVSRSSRVSLTLIDPILGDGMNVWIRSVTFYTVCLSHTQILLASKL